MAPSFASTQGLVPNDPVTMSTSALSPAALKASMTRETGAPPQLSSVRTGRICASGATPAIPSSFSRTAATIPATCVPWSASPVGAAVLHPPPPSTSSARGRDVVAQVGMVHVDAHVDHRDRDALALGAQPGLVRVDVRVGDGAREPVRARLVVEGPLQGVVDVRPDAGASIVPAAWTGASGTAKRTSGSALSAASARSARAAGTDTTSVFARPSMRSSDTPASERISARSEALRPGSRPTMMSSARAAAGSTEPNAQTSASARAKARRECVTLVSSAITWGP